MLKRVFRPYCTTHQVYLNIELLLLLLILFDFSNASLTFYVTVTLETKTRKNLQHTEFEIATSGILC